VTENNNDNILENDQELDIDDKMAKSEIGGMPPKVERKKSFLVELFGKIENFSKEAFESKKAETKIKKKEVTAKKKELKESETTIADIQNQRTKLIKNTMYKFFLVVFVVILISGAIVLALQDNEQLARKSIDIKELLNDTTSFGKIDEKDYFLEQNILDDKINMVEKNAKEERAIISKNIVSQTDDIKGYLDDKFMKYGNEQTKENTELKEEILSEVDKKIDSVTVSSNESNKKLKMLEEKVENYKNRPSMKLQDGKIIFPEQKKAQVLNSIHSNTDAGDAVQAEQPIEDEYKTVETDMSNVVVQELTFDTGMDENTSKVLEGIEFDLTTTLVRVTLINGIKAPTLDIGVKNPTPVLMSIDGVAYAANKNTRRVLEGCLLRGIAVGNINTSRAEIFGTHLSCILEKDDGRKYKIEHNFPNNQVWIKGEDGADGVAGLIVDSSGKILSKSAAIGFMQGLTNYFSAQNLVTGGTATLGANTSTTAQLGTSMRSGAGEGLSTGFDLIISKYEEILGGYYPFIDVKGGRKNLTAIFGGGVKLVGTPYIEPNLEN